jgi:Domain of unknown function (DUF4760)
MVRPLAEISVRVVDQGIDWTAWITAGASIVTAALVLGTAIVAYRALEDAKRTRHAQLITELTRDWTHSVVVEAQSVHAKYAETGIVSLVERLFGPTKVKPTDDELSDWSKIVVVANSIEALGVLASEEAITPETIYKMWGGAILTAWPAWDEAITKLREYDREPDTFEYFEKIAQDMKRISEERRAARGVATSASRDPQADAEAEPGKNDQSSAPPSDSPGT